MGVSETVTRASVLDIDGYAYPAMWPGASLRAEEGDEEGVRLWKEDCLLFAKGTLERCLARGPFPAHIRWHKLDTWQAWLMFLVARIAKEFEVDRKKLLKMWMDDWWPSIVSGARLPVWHYKPMEGLMTEAEALQLWLRKAEQKA